MRLGLGLCVRVFTRACVCVRVRACLMRPVRAACVSVCERVACVCLAASVRDRQWWRRAVQAAEGRGAGRINSPAGHSTLAIDSDRPTGFSDV